ncbi:CapA family protein [Patescibacteria group bacterium]|nr:CapA family protein [Patescibacteria group bacterium]
MLDRGVEFTVNKYGEKDWRFSFLEIADDLKEADILFGNLEGPISDKGTKVGSIYSFWADPQAIKGLSFAGFDILSVANNHMFDYGREAMQDTFLRLKEAEIDYIGGGFNEKEAHSPLIRKIRGPTLGQVKVAFLAYTNLGSENWAAKGDNSGIAWLTKERLEKDIKETKKQADIVVISMHFGEEYQSQPTPEQKFFSRLAIDSGADLVIGHHSHVIQEIEKYNEGYIDYSLGNFVFDQGFSEETMRSLMLKVFIEDGKIKEVVPIEIKINNFFQPSLEINQ